MLHHTVFDHQGFLLGYLEHQKHKQPSHGKIPVKKLVGQGEGAKSIEVTDSNIKSFERAGENRLCLFRLHDGK